MTIQELENGNKVLDQIPATNLCHETHFHDQGMRDENAANINFEAAILNESRMDG